MRFGAVAVALLVAGAPLSAAAAPSPTPTPGTPAGGSTPTPAFTSPTSPSPSAASAPLPVSVTLGQLTPIAPQPGDVVHVTGTLRNTSSASVTEISVQLRYRSSHIGSRGEFDDYATGTRAPDGTIGPLPLPPLVAASSIPPRRTLAPGQAEPFDVSVHVDDLHLDPWQVYEIAVGVSGATATGFGTVGGLRTFLPWAPVNATGVGFRTQVAWVWPLVDRPHRTVDDTWTDDALAASIRAGGRLADLLTAGIAAENQSAPAPPPRKRRHKQKPTVPVTSVPVTWAVDPLLVEDLAAMQGGYRVGVGRSARRGTGADEARAWLKALREATTRTELLSLPYADPDVVAATRTGSVADTGLAPEMQVAINSGATLVAKSLSATPLPYAWPPSGLVDQHTLDTLFAAGVSTVVLDGSALPPATSPSVTPNAHTTVRARDGNLDVLLADSGLSTVVGIGAREPDKGPLAIQRFLAETLMIQAEQPNIQRTLVVAPDRRWAPTAAYAAQLASDTGKVPWIEPVPLSRALAAAPTPGVVRAPLSYPPLARHAELPQSYVREVRALKSDADRFAEIVPPGDAQARDFDDAVLRTLSSAWRGHRAQADSYRTMVATQLNATMHRVRITSPGGSFVTLTSHSGTVPVTVANELDTPVSVIVAISSQHLRLSGQGRAAQVIPPHRQIAVDVRAAARTSGVFPLTVRLLTRTGRPYDKPEQLFVRSTAYGFVAIVITGGATAALLLAVAIRLVRRAFGARRAEADAT